MVDILSRDNDERTAILKLFMKFGLFFSILILFPGCYTITFVDENEEGEIIEPTPATQLITDLAPFLIQELILVAEPHPEHPHQLPPVIHEHKNPAGTTTHTDKQRSTQTGRSVDTNTQSANRDESRQNTRDSGARRSGR
jgi:hypothetical protein